MRKILTIIITLLATVVFAQKPTNKAIQGISLNCKDSILLRWAPMDYQTWERNNKLGYLIKKIETDTLKKKTKSWTVTIQPLKPQPMDFWRKYVEADNKYGSIAAQALYGESFEINTGKSNDVINMIKEREQRFSFALFSADHSFQIAKDMGLGYTDLDIKKNCIYTYVISLPKKAPNDKPSPPLLVLRGNMLIETKLPMVVPIKAENNNGDILLSFPLQPYTGIYSDYAIERSLDGGINFQILNDLPVVNTTEQDLDSLKTGYVVDNSAPVHQPVFYRIKGATPFDILGPFSAPIQTIPFYNITQAPKLEKINQLKGLASISWEMPEDSAIVKSFTVEKSYSPLGPFKVIDSLKYAGKINYQLTDKATDEVNYYRIGAVGFENHTKYSLTQQLLIPDTIPPIAPKGLNGEISDKGIVRLNWDKNLEPDMFGYRVFKANAPQDQFVQITDSAGVDNNYKDSINIKTLSKYIYYRVVAVDRKFNPSDFSEILKLKRPDIIPPVAPTITGISAIPEGINISWINSSSDDVVKHQLWRKTEIDGDWKELVTLTDTTQRYCDKSTELKKLYSYKLIAVDDSGLSSSSKEYSKSKLDLGLKPNIENFSGSADRDNQRIDLKWNYKLEGVKSYVIYKAQKNKPLRLFKLVNGDTTSFVDDQLTINTEYQYRIKAFFIDESETQISKPIFVKY